MAGGDRILFARNADPLANGGLPAVDHTFSFSLVNGAGVAGGPRYRVEDHAVPHQGQGAEDPVSNDDPMNWCPATTPYGDGDLGSPKAAGETCP